MKQKHYKNMFDSVKCTDEFKEETIIRLRRISGEIKTIEYGYENIELQNQESNFKLESYRAKRGKIQYIALTVILLILAVSAGLIFKDTNNNDKPKPVEPLETKPPIDSEIENEFLKGLSTEKINMLFKEQEDIEECFPESEFKDMEDSKLLEYLKQFNKDMTGIGRVDQYGNSYIVFTTVKGVDFPNNISYEWIENEAEGIMEHNVFSIDKNTAQKKVLYKLTNEVYLDEENEIGIFSAKINTWVNCKILMSRDGREYVKKKLSEGIRFTNYDEDNVVVFFRFETELQKYFQLHGPQGNFLILTEKEKEKLSELCNKENFKSYNKGKYMKNSYRTGAQIWIGDNVYELCVNGEEFYFEVWNKEDYNRKNYVNKLLSDWLINKQESAFKKKFTIYSSDWFNTKLQKAVLKYKCIYGENKGQVKTQEIYDEKKLEELADILKNGDLNSDGNCAPSQPLTLTREDGEELTLYIASDDCGTALIDGNIDLGFDRKIFNKIFDEIFY